MGNKSKARIETAILKKKRKQKRKVIIFFSVIAIILLVILAVDFFPAIQNRTDPKANLELFEEKIELVHKSIFTEKFPDNSFAEYFDPQKSDLKHVTFISITDSTNRAKVVSGTGINPEDSWNNAVENAREYLRMGGMSPLWIKADLVDFVEKVKYSELSAVVRPFRNEFFRKGISLDKQFDAAFMETEINGNKLLDYEKNQLDISNINIYLKSFGRKIIETIPEEVFLFTTLGWFCDENNHIYELYGYEGQGYDTGRRVLDEFNKDVAREVILSASKWLDGEIKNDGSFVYGYYPTYDRAFTAYNMLRHAVSIQPLLWHYKITGSDELLPGVQKTIKYLTEGHTGYKEDGVAFIIDRPNSEIKLGGNALAIITLELYMRTLETDMYKQLCIDLGHGILDLMDRENGTFYHVLNLDFSPKEEFRTVYYDGESAYALCLLYEMTGDEKWIEAAKSAVENFIRNDYTKYRDHWVAYALNEVTKHYPEQRFYEFALRNVQENLNAIYNRDTSYHTYLELLMASFNLYDRILENNIQVDYMENFDSRYFIDTIFHRAQHMLNGYIYPEYAMYLKNPQKITGSFFIRHDGYRIRIDDVEHFIAGYYSFWKNYDKLIEYRDSYR